MHGRHVTNRVIGTAGGRVAGRRTRKKKFRNATWYKCAKRISDYTRSASCTRTVYTAVMCASFVLFRFGTAASKREHTSIRLLTRACVYRVIIERLYTHNVSIRDNDDDVKSRSPATVVFPFLFFLFNPVSYSRHVSDIRIQRRQEV